jgi:hypothetical protein
MSAIPRATARATAPCGHHTITVDVRTSCLLEEPIDKGASRVIAKLADTL